MDGRLGGVDDEVSEGEAEAQRGASQAEGLGARPGERLLLHGPRRRRRLALVTTLTLLFGLGGREGERETERQRERGEGEYMNMCLFCSHWNHITENVNNQ